MFSSANNQLFLKLHKNTAAMHKQYTAFRGWNRYDAGELSTITILLKSRPNRLKSCKHNQSRYSLPQT